MKFKSKEHKKYYRALVNHLKQRTAQRLKIIKPVEDKDLMPFGIHKGKAMVNVPASYLLWLWENKKYNTEVKKYIENNLDVIKKECRTI